MNCPVCQVELKMADRQGVEIDYCPKCRGVWLDRGELDKLIERSNSAFAGGTDWEGERYRKDDSERYEREYHGYKKRKRESFFGDLFDFD